MIDPQEFGKAMGGIIRDAVSPLLKRIEDLESRSPERGERGETGLQGEPGHDADPIAVSDVVSELLDTEALGTLVSLQVADEVAKYFEANPVKNGKDGTQGVAGPAGEKGADGADGVGIAGALINRDSELVITTTKGEQVNLGRVVGSDGAAGRDGKDGADFSEVELDYDGERGLIIRGKGGEIVKRMPIPIDRGYWRDGMSAEKADVVTQEGCVWIALKDTNVKPCRENASDWRMMARKGRDGMQGPAGKDYNPPEPVKLS